MLGLTNGDYTIEPWTPIDSLAWLKAMAWDLRGNMESEIDRAVAARQRADPRAGRAALPRLPVRPQRARSSPSGAVVNGAFDAGRDDPARRHRRARPRSAWRDAAPALAGAGRPRSAGCRSCSATAVPGIGSNSWVIGGAHTTTGKPMLANDPHLSPSMPGIWYQMGLHCACAVQRGGLHASPACRASSSGTTTGSPGASPTSTPT